MSPRNHDRSPEKQNFSIALPKVLIQDLQAIADNESRSRNRQIERFLAESVSEWKLANPGKISPMPLIQPLKVAEEPGNESSLSTRAPGAPSIKYPQGRRRKS